MGSYTKKIEKYKSPKIGALYTSLPALKLWKAGRSFMAGDINGVFYYCDSQFIFT